MGKTIKITYRGATYEVQGEEDLEKILRKLNLLLPGEPLPSPPPPSIAGAGRAADLFVVLTELERFPKGLSADRIARIAKAKSARGLAGVSRAWSRLLGELGFEFEEVVVRSRRSREYWWTAGPRLQAAIEAITRARVEGRL